MERLRFSDGSQMDLQIRPNDEHFAKQWNLHTTDVAGAWRFTTGSKNILLTSLDSGIATASGGQGGIVDIATGRLVVSDDDDFKDYGHGHAAVSVMASNTNNGSGVSGMNWASDAIVRDVYGRGIGGSRVSLFDAIRNSIEYARLKGQKVVFQGGVQGESWLKDGATRSQLEQLIRDNSDIALFAVAAGNGGPGGNLKDSNYLTSVSGVAKLETNHQNVISVGALTFVANNRDNRAFTNGLVNTSDVDIASYSNRGSNLTLVAPTDSPAMTKLGDMRYFGGTSAANPNMAGIASLVWSANSALDGGELRQILIDTSMDLGASGRDNTFGHGLVNAEAAVRRAWALKKDNELAQLYSGQSVAA
jgi:serine protease